MVGGGYGNDMYKSYVNGGIPYYYGTDPMSLGSKLRIAGAILMIVGIALLVIDNKRTKKA